MVFFNVHDKIYKIRSLPRNNSGDNLIKNNLDSKIVQVSTKKCTKRSISPMGKRPIRAFNEANKFINIRKNIKIK